MGGSGAASTDLFLLEEIALHPPVNLLCVEGVVGTVGVTVANHDQGPGGAGEGAGVAVGAGADTWWIPLSRPV